jgi:hypothetical protein
MGEKKKDVARVPQGGVARGDPSAPEATNRHTMLLRPSLSATLGLDALARDMLGRHFDAAELEATEATLIKGTLQVHDGELLAVEAMLLGQAKVLDALFIDLLTKGLAEGGGLTAKRDYLPLALKAQAQSRATLQALIEAKQPRSFIVAQQANVAGGHQQVNNSTSSCAPANATGKPANELLERASDGQAQWVDAGAQAAPARSDQEVDAMGFVDRAPQRRRQSASVTKRTQARVAKRRGT